MTRRPFAPLGATCFLLLAPLGALAGSITLNSDVRILDSAGTVTFEGTLANTGRTLADRVVLVFEPPFGASSTNQLGHLDPADKVTWRATVQHPEDARTGKYVAIARAYYQDPNGEPLTSLFVLPYTAGRSAKRPVAKVALQGVPPTEGNRPVPMEKAVTLRLSLTPFSRTPRPLALRVVLPESLAVVPPLPKPSELPATPAEWTLSITNLSALAGSVLPVAVLVETDVDGHHQTLVAQTQVNVHGPGTGVRPPQPPAPWHAPLWALGLWTVAELVRRKRNLPSPPGLWVDLLALGVATYMVARQLALPLLAADTLAIGGDTPAHHYLATHLAHSLARGKLVSWAPGWWSGFPMFQFYFPLPYLVMAGLDLVLPYNIAFKAGTILGLLALPFGAYAGGRLLRLPRPLPALLALASLPLLLDTTHTMWGVNAYSTFAGMISNSYSFAIFPAALASLVRDALDARPRFRTIVLVVLVVLSHFFTAIVLALLAALLFAALLARAAATRDADAWNGAMALVPIGLLSFLLMAWWLVPLVATRAWSVDFGDAWKIRTFHNLPILARWTLVPGVATALALLGFRRVRLPSNWRIVAGVHLAMMGLALFLYAWGGRISPVFVNCRLWPFWVHSTLVLAVLAAGVLVCRARLPVLGTLTVALAILAFPWDPPNHARYWAAFNFGGLEARPDGPFLKQLADTLRGTPGRLATDLHPGNEHLGSSRIFEAMPALCGKPILEGGIVNSALGSLAAYSVQGEISDNPAGWPLLVKPRRFDPATGLRRIELMGAKHFVARSRTVQRALDADPAWTLRTDFGKWRLYENTAVDGALVRAWNTDLPYLRSREPQRDIVRWLGRRDAIAAPWVFLREGDPLPPVGTEWEPPEEGRGDVPPPPGFLGTVSRSVPLSKDSTPDHLRFHAEALGRPHLIAVSYFPNWRVSGARHIYLAGPGYMVVYPEEHEVELRFERTGADKAGLGLTGIGLLVLFAWWADTRGQGRSRA